jgi:CMP-N,N'-diacetyllegionaminic acid synthase
LTISSPFILALIPARGGSKGVPRKNLRMLNGRPLIAHSIATGLACPSISAVVVTTEDEQIAEVARACGAKVPFVRPEALASDETPMEPVIQHAVLQIEDLYKAKVDYVVLLVPTNPFRTAEQVESGLRILLESGADSVVSLVEEDYPLAWLQTVVDGKVVPKFPSSEVIHRRQDAPRVFKRNDGFFMFTRETIMERGVVQGPDTRPFMMSPLFSVDIDNEWDFQLAELLIQQANNRSSEA